MRKKHLFLSLALIIVLISSMLLSSCGEKIRRMEIVGEGVKTDEDGGKYVVVYLDESNKASYQIEYKIYPESAGKREVEFLYNKTTPHVTVDENGLVSFTSVTAIEVTVMPKESEKFKGEAKILIIAKHKNA